MPRLMWPGSATGPKRTRIRRLTTMPTASIILRTSRFFPSRSTTWYQWFAPSPPRSSSESKVQMSPSISTPVLVSLSICSGVSSPRRRTAYSRSTSKRGWVRRLASSPLVVNMSSPLVFRSRRPTETQRPPCTFGRRSKTVARFSGSSRVTISLSGLL